MSPFEFLLLPHYCTLRAGSIRLRAIVNKKQCDTRGLFMSLVIHYWVGDVQDSQGVSAPVLTYIVSSGALSCATRSLTFERPSCTVLLQVADVTHLLQPACAAGVPQPKTSQAKTDDSAAERWRLWTRVDAVQYSVCCTDTCACVCALLMRRQGGP